MLGRKEATATKGARAQVDGELGAPACESRVNEKRHWQRHGGKRADDGTKPLGVIGVVGAVDGHHHEILAIFDSGGQWEGSPATESRTRRQTSVMTSPTRTARSPKFSAAR